MCDCRVTFVPTDPHYVPDRDAVISAIRYLDEGVAEHAEDVEASQYRGPQRHLANEDLPSTIRCPHCGEELDLEWWLQTCEADWEGQGYRMEDFVLPCCLETSNLARLDYNHQAAFGRFTLGILNPTFTHLGDGVQSHLEGLLSCLLQVITTGFI